MFVWETHGGTADCANSIVPRSGVSGWPGLLAHTAMDINQHNDIMKRAIVIALAMLVSISAFAGNDKKEEKKDPRNYLVRLYLADGTTVEGYNETNFDNYLFPCVSEVSITPEYKSGEKITYTSDQVTRVEFLYIKEGNAPLIYDAVKCQSSNPIKKEVKTYKKLAFVRLIYDGENVKGYAMPWTDQTLTKSMNMLHYTYKYYYKTKDSDTAMAYWVDSKGITVGAKAALKVYFADFPEVVKMLDNGEIDPKTIKANPASILPILDETYVGK